MLSNAARSSRLLCTGQDAFSYFFLRIIRNDLSSINQDKKPCCVRTAIKRGWRKRVLLVMVPHASPSYLLRACAHRYNCVEGEAKKSSNAGIKIAWCPRQCPFLQTLLGVLWSRQITPVSAGVDQPHLLPLLVDSRRGNAATKLRFCTLNLVCT